MAQFELVLLAVTIVAVLAMLGMAAVAGRAGGALSRARSDRDGALMAEAATMRVLRMSIADLRADTMRLLGYAERMVEQDGREPPSHVSGILAMVQQLLQHADDMQDYAVPSAGSRRLQPEPIPLRALIDDTIATVAATLGPSARHWRMGGGLDDMTLLGDRRALTHVFGRVLSNAARHSRHTTGSISRSNAG